MDSLKFGTNEQLYDGTATPVGKNKVSIEFAGGIPKGIDTSHIEVSTKSGVQFQVLDGFTTEYRRIDACLILSNDGTVFPGEVVVEVDAEKALEDARASKKNEISVICKSTIQTGTDVEVSGQSEHFRMTEDDQLNLLGKQIQLMSGETKFEYHEDGNPCRYFTAEEMTKILTEVMFFKSYHTTYCNALNMWIAGAETIEEVKGITYGCEVPDAYQSEVLKDYISKMAGITA